MELKNIQGDERRCATVEKVSATQYRIASVPNSNQPVTITPVATSPGRNNTLSACQSFSD